MQRRADGNEACCGVCSDGSTLETKTSRSRWSVWLSLSQMAREASRHAHLLGTVALQVVDVVHKRLVAEIQANTLGPAFLIAAANAGKFGVPVLAWHVPRRDRLFAHGADNVLKVEPKQDQEEKEDRKSRPESN